MDLWVCPPPSWCTIRGVVYKEIAQWQSLVLYLVLINVSECNLLQALGGFDSTIFWYTNMAVAILTNSSLCVIMIVVQQVYKSVVPTGMAWPSDN